MRVTNSMLVTNSIYNINNNTRRLDKAQQQESTQSKIQLPSDDPEVATQAVKYRNYVSTVEQYQKNVDDATSWMKVTEGALSDLHDVVQQVRDLTVEASNTGTNSTSNLSDIKQEVAELKKTAVQILNTSYAGRYIFAGYETDKEPYQITSLPVGATSVEKVTFKDQIVDMNGAVSPDLNAADYETAYANALSSGKVYQDTGVDQAMKYNIGFQNQITVNVEGQDVVGTDSANNLFATLDKLLIGLDSETSYQTIANGTATGSNDLSTLTYPVTVTVGSQDTLSLSVDSGTATTITIPAGTYASSSALITAVNKGIGASALNGKVTAALNSSNQIVFTSASTSGASAVTVTDGNGAMAAYIGTPSSLSGGVSKATSFTLSDILGDLDTDLDRISAITSSLGARENTASIATNRLGDDNTVYTKLMSTNEDMNAAEATTNVATATTVYEASLAAAAKAISKSLLDYIS